MDAHPELALFLRQTLSNEETVTLLRTQLQNRIKDKIVNVENPAQAYNVKLELDAAAGFWSLLEEIMHVSTEGEDDNA